MFSNYLRTEKQSNELKLSLYICYIIIENFIHFSWYNDIKYKKFSFKINNNNLLINFIIRNQHIQQNCALLLYIYFFNNYSFKINKIHTQQSQIHQLLIRFFSKTLTQLHNVYKSIFTTPPPHNLSPIQPDISHE